MLLVGTFILFALSFACADNLELLSGTLKTHQRAACDEETMTLKCPLGTKISITVARFGGADGVAVGKCSTANPVTGEIQPNNTCVWPDALQSVVEICQKKRQCKFNTSPESFHRDPCPGLPKYIEVAYKCRPHEFRSKVACENEVINLSCYPGHRVAVYSATFGRTEYESIQCPQPVGVKEENCLANYATETVIQICHGKRKCSVVANSTTFGEPCMPESRTYLKIVYTCVPRSVLRAQYQGETEPDEEQLVNELDEGFDRADFRAEFSPSPNVEGPQPQPRDNVSRESPSVSSSPPRARTNNDGTFFRKIVESRSNKLSAAGKDEKRYRLSTDGIAMNNVRGNNSIDGLIISPTNCSTVYGLAEEDRAVVGYLNEWIGAYSFITNNQEKFYLYIIVSVAAGIVIFSGLVIGRLLMSRHKAKRDAKFNANNESLPNGFTDDISEIDADIDLTTPVPVPMQDTRVPETQLAERLHGDRYFSDTRLPLSPTSVHTVHHVPETGIRVDLGNHMVGTDSLHTILRPENSRGINSKSFYYG